MSFDETTQKNIAKSLREIATNLNGYITDVSSVQTKTQSAWSEGRVPELDALYDETKSELSKLATELGIIADDIDSQAESVRLQEEAAEREAARAAQLAAQQAAAAQAAAMVYNNVVTPEPIYSTALPSTTKIPSKATLAKIKELESEIEKHKNRIKAWSRVKFLFTSQIKKAEAEIESLEKQIENLMR